MRRFALGSVVLVALALFNGCAGSPGNAGGGSKTATFAAASVYVVNDGSAPVTIYQLPVGSSTAVAATTTTTLPSGFLIADEKVDSTGKLYVSGATASYAPELLVYTPGSATPSVTLNALAYGSLAIDSSNNVYIFGLSTPYAYVYASGITATSTPARSFTCASCSLAGEGVVAASVDSAGNIYLAGFNTSFTEGEFDQLPAGASGTVTPTRTILYPTAELFGVAADSAGNVYLSAATYNSAANTTSALITVYPAGTSTAAIKTITLNTSSQSEFGNIAIDSSGYLYAVAAVSNGTTATIGVDVFPTSASGSTTPTITISASGGQPTDYYLAIH